MSDAPEFVFEEGYFLYRGEVNSNEFHSNPAYQIATVDSGSICVSNDNEFEFVGQHILIPPLVKHKIRSSEIITLIYFSPISNWILRALKHINKLNITILDAEILPFDKAQDLDDIVKSFESYGGDAKLCLDPRLLAAIEDLNANLTNASILETAKRCNLSRSRLRTLAREQISLPLSTWLMWRKIVEANKALSTGVSLSEAALMGGFSDQAHFTRTMKRMFGVTPTQASRVYT